MTGLLTPPIRDARQVIVWFSCGAASAVAAKLTLENTDSPVEIVYCDTSADEHADNQRFFLDVQEWLAQPITTIRSEKYRSIEDVFAARRYMSGIAGAPCTVEMKKIPRFHHQGADDTHVFGLTSDEPTRINRFKKANPDLRCRWILQDLYITKTDCLQRIAAAGIDLPAMYRLGYKNNNCIGCVKATSERYWSQIRRDFPDVFARRVAQSRDIGARLTRTKGRRIFLDELPDDDYSQMTLEDVSCGPECADTGDEK